MEAHVTLTGPVGGRLAVLRLRVVRLLRQVAHVRPDAFRRREARLRLHRVHHEELKQRRELQREGQWTEIDDSVQNVKWDWLRCGNQHLMSEPVSF